MRTKLRDRSRAAGKRAHGIAAKLRSRSQLGRDQVKDGVQRITGELADLAQATVRDAQRLLVNARRALRQARVKAAKLAEAGVRDAAAGRRRGRLTRAVNDLSNLLEATEQIIGQTRQRIAGVKWRTGSEGRISYLKRGFGWDRTRIDGTEGARIWTGHGVLAHNLVKISALAG